MIEFFVHGVPQTQGNLRAVRTNAGHAMLREANRNVHDWRQVVAVAAQPMAKMHPGPVLLDLTFYLPRPKALKARTDVPHTKRPDISKLQRAIEDALTGVLYNDDSQITDVVVRKRYALPEGPVGVQIRLCEPEEAVG